MTATPPLKGMDVNFYKATLGSELLRWYQTWQPQTVVDIGTARGDVLFNIVRYDPPVSSVIGVDISRTALKMAKMLVNRKVHELGRSCQVQFVEGSAVALPLPDNAGDMGTTHGLFIHLRPDEVRQGLQEFFRVVPKGLLIESSCHALAKNDAHPTTDRTKRYWEVRSRYFSTTMMTNLLRKFIESFPYYFAHDYLALFRSLGLRVIDRVMLDEGTQTFAYAVARR